MATTDTPYRDRLASKLWYQQDLFALKIRISNTTVSCKFICIIYIEISQTIDTVTIDGKASVQTLSVLYGRVGGAKVLVALSVPSATALMVFWAVHP